MHGSISHEATMRQQMHKCDLAFPYRENAVTFSGNKSTHKLRTSAMVKKTAQNAHVYKNAHNFLCAPYPTLSS